MHHSKRPIFCLVTVGLIPILNGCGGGSSAPPPPPPSAIVVSVSPGTAAVQAGATAHLSATVANDPSNNGVTWNVSCSVANCGTVSPNATPSGAVATYTAPSPLPSVGITISVTATSVTDASKSSSVTLIPVGHIQGYDVGVDYHAFGSDFDSTAFITIYNQPAVRQTVQTQLQGMADRGATIIQTAIWFVTEPGTTNFNQTWRATFPMADQEAANLQMYAQDVAAVQGSDGNRLRLILALNWLGAADFTIGTPTTGLGYSNLSAAEYIFRIQTTTDKVLGAVSGVTRPDGVPVVSRIFLDCGVTIPAPGESDGNPNEGWFLTSNYPRFVSVVSQSGIEPSVYFNVDFSQAAVLDDTYVDSVYPALNGHRSMFWPYRGMKFMVDNGLPIPAEIEFAWYMTSTSATYNQLAQRILADADATLPSLGAPQIYGAAETYYYSDAALCLQYGQAFATLAAQNPQLRRVSFWTTPDGGGKGVNIAYPFATEDFLPPPN
ncbi:MAG TPA: hypothetical protein VEI73_11880 [Candidatus Acidoferrum sp.]|nr:hypothetical protein [Candidatus Acidoferrum sp.]